MLIPKKSKAGGESNGCHTYFCPVSMLFLGTGIIGLEKFLFYDVFRNGLKPLACNGSGKQYTNVQKHVGMYLGVRVVCSEKC